VIYSLMGENLEDHFYDAQGKNLYAIQKKQV